MLRSGEKSDKIKVLEQLIFLWIWIHNSLSNMEMIFFGFIFKLRKGASNSRFVGRSLEIFSTALNHLIEQIHEKQSCQRSWIDSQNSVAIYLDCYFKLLGPKNPE